jgi:hypothetical protein
MQRFADALRFDRDRLGTLASLWLTLPAPAVRSGWNPRRKGYAGPGRPVWHQALAPYKPRRSRGSRPSPAWVPGARRDAWLSSHGASGKLRRSLWDSPVIPRGYRQPRGELRPAQAKLRVGPVAKAGGSPLAKSGDGGSGHRPLHSRCEGLQDWRDSGVDGPLRNGQLSGLAGGLPGPVPCGESSSALVCRKSGSVLCRLLKEPSSPLGTVPILDIGDEGCCEETALDAESGQWIRAVGTGVRLKPTGVASTILTHAHGPRNPYRGFPSPSARCGDRARESTGSDNPLMSVFTGRKSCGGGGSLGDWVRLGRAENQILESPAHGRADTADS